MKITGNPPKCGITTLDKVPMGSLVVILLDESRSSSSFLGRLFTVCSLQHGFLKLANPCANAYATSINEEYLSKYHVRILNEGEKLSVFGGKLVNNDLIPKQASHCTGEVVQLPGQETPYMVIKLMSGVTLLNMVNGKTDAIDPECMVIPLNATLEIKS